MGDMISILNIGYRIVGKKKKKKKQQQQLNQLSISPETTQFDTRRTISQ